MGRSSRMAGAALVLFFSGDALAQSVQPPPGPSERRRPEFDPVGGRIGSFMLFPRAEARLEYNDNVLANASGNDGDVLATVRADARLTSLWERHQAQLSGYLAQTVHADLTTEDRLEGGGRAEGALDLNRRARLNGYLGFDALAENRTNIASVTAARSPVRFTRLMGGIGYNHDLDPVVIGVDLFANRLDFQDAVTRTGEPLDQDFRDSTFVSGAVRAGVRVGPGLTAIVRANVDRFVHDVQAAGPLGFDRDSTGAEIEAGVGFELTSLIFGEARIGYLRRWSDDPRFQGASGLSYGLNVTWSVTPLTEVRLTGDRSVEEGGTLDTAGNIRSTATLRVEHELLRSLILDGEATLAQIDPLGPLPDATEYGLRLGATWLINRRLRLLGQYSFFRRQTDQAIGSLSQNRLWVTARLSF